MCRVKWAYLSQTGYSFELFRRSNLCFNWDCSIESKLNLHKLDLFLEVKVSHLKFAFAGILPKKLEAGRVGTRMS